MENDTQLVVCELGNPMVAGANVRKPPFPSFVFEKICLHNDYFNILVIYICDSVSPSLFISPSLYLYAVILFTLF